MRATRRPAFVTGRNQHVGRQSGDQQQCMHRLPAA
jgi:hypothetical protein